MSISFSGYDRPSYLFTSLAVKQDPSQFDHFRGVFRNINAMFITGGRNVNDHVTIEFRRGRSVCGHGNEVSEEYGEFLVYGIFGGRKEILKRSAVVQKSAQQIRLASRTSDLVLTWRQASAVMDWMTRTNSC